MFRTSWFIFGQTAVQYTVCFTCNGVPEHTLLSTRLNINLENCAFLWFMLCNYTTMHGAKKHKKTVSEVMQPCTAKFSVCQSAHWNRLTKSQCYIKRLKYPSRLDKHAFTLFLKYNVIPWKASSVMLGMRSCILRFCYYSVCSLFLNIFFQLPPPPKIKNQCCYIRRSRGHNFREKLRSW